LNDMLCRFNGKISIAGLIACLSFQATAALQNPYHIISERNSFRLQPMPVPLPLPETKIAPPLPLDIRLTGIVPLFGESYVILEINNPQTQKTERPPLLREGDAYHDEVRIVSIDAQKGVVRISSRGVETALDFEKNGIKPKLSTPAPTPPLPPRTLAPPTLPGTGRSILSGDPTAKPSPAPLNAEELRAAMDKRRALYQQQNDPRAAILPQNNLARVLQTATAQ
jgi:hypothetical protein